MRKYDYDLESVYMNREQIKNYQLQLVTDQIVGSPFIDRNQAMKHQLRLLEDQMNVRRR